MGDLHEHSGGIKLLRLTTCRRRLVLVFTPLLVAVKVTLLMDVWTLKPSTAVAYRMEDVYTRGETMGNCIYEEWASVRVCCKIDDEVVSRRSPSFHITPLFSSANSALY